MLVLNLIFRSMEMRYEQQMLMRSAFLVVLSIMVIIQLTLLLAFAHCDEK